MVRSVAGSSGSNTPVQELPPRASLENLRKRAKTLLERHREGDAEALARVASLMPGAEAPLALHDAQLVTARQYGFASWPKLVSHLKGAAAGLAAEGRVWRDQGRTWLEGVGRLRWGASPEPTYVGALEAAFRGSDRPLDVTTLMGDSALCFRVRWATRDGGKAWCGSGPCGEWPEEVALLNAATGYVYAWTSDANTGAADLGRRITEHIDRGWPILGFALKMDMGVIYGYEDGGQRLLVSDYWASEQPAILPLAEAKEVGMFMERIDVPTPRSSAVRAGLELAIRRWQQGVVDPDPITGATHHYGSAAYRRWIADLERWDSLSEAQRSNLYFINGWTFSSLYSSRGEHAAKYLRESAEHMPAAARPRLEAAAQRYDRARERLGKWDAADPIFGFVKQKNIDTWTPEVRKREIALLRVLYELDTHALGDIERALSATD